MTRPEMVFNRFKIFQAGAGGTGGYLALILSKFIKDLESKRGFDITYTIYDNDVVEPKNVKRQNFIDDDVDKIKAEVIGNRYSIPFESNFLTPSSIEFEYLYNNTGVNIILGCTDSIQFRIDMIKYLKTKMPDDMLWVYIDGGNLDKSGQTLVASNLPSSNVYSEGAEDLEKLFSDFSETPEAKAMETESCADLGDQTIGMNFTSALYLYNILTEFLGTSKITCNTIVFRRYSVIANYDVNETIENGSY